MSKTPPTGTNEVRAAAKARKAKSLVLFVTLSLCVVALAAMVIALTARFSGRFDVTATGEQRLAPRTLRVVDQLQGEHRVVVATDLRKADPRSVRTLRDTLEEFSARSPSVAFAVIDTASESGVAQFRGLLAGLARRDEAPLREQSETCRGAIAGVSALVLATEQRVEQALSKAQAAATKPAPRAAMESLLAGTRLTRRDLAEAGKSAAESLEVAPDAGNPLPRPDRAAALLLAGLTRAKQSYEGLMRDAIRLTQGEFAEAATTPHLQTLLAEATAARDSSGQIMAALGALPKLDSFRIADALAQSEGALVVGPSGKGVVGMDLSTLLPSGAWLDATGAGAANLRTRTEEVISSSLATLLVPERPIVVLTHAESDKLFAKAQLIDSVRDRLSARGMDVMEWSVLESAKPDFSTLGSAASLAGRPVVYATLTPNTAASAGSGLSGADRAGKLAAAVQTLVDGGESVLVSLGPSILPALGQKDPMDAVLARFGVVVKTGTPLLTAVPTPRGVGVETDRVAQTSGSDAGSTPVHPLVGAMRGLPTYLTWALPIEPVTGTGSKAADAVRTVMPVLVARAASDTWAETQWLRYRQTPREQRVLLPDPPRFDAGEAREPAAAFAVAPGVWTMAVACEVVMEASGEGKSRKQRAVIVGSNDWFIDAVTMQQTAADGRAVLQNPGNLEFFESSVLWLCGQDQLIAQSATARAVPVVKQIDPGSLARLRWGLAVGMPGLALCVGIAYALWRK